MSREGSGKKRISFKEEDNSDEEDESPPEEEDEEDDKKVNLCYAYSALSLIVLVRIS